MKFFSIALLCFSSFFLQAQETMPKLAIGAGGGYHTSFMEFGNSVRWDYAESFSGGLHFQYMSRKMLGFETGLIYGQYGWFEDNATGQPIGRRTITMLELPLYSHLSLGKGPLRFLVDAGPYFRFRLKEKNEGVTFGEELFMDSDFENKALDNGTSYGLAFQGGLAWRTNAIIIQARGNFHFGLTNYFQPVRNVLELSAERSAGGSISVLIPFGNKYIDE